MAVGTTIKTIQDIMRKDAGVDGDAQRISQMSWMLFLKIFDDKEKEYELFRKGYRSPMPDRLRWRNWAADPEGITGDVLLKFIDADLFPTLKELPAEAGSNGSGILLRRVFEDSYNYMKNGTLVRQVANKINDIDFNKTEDRHLFGEIYEKILKDLQSAGNAGEYYTPRAVTQFMVDQVEPKLGESILDPACGTGGFLACAIENIRKTVKTIEDEDLLQSSIHGVEKKPMPHLLCVTNMMLHGIDVPIQIRHDNTLARPLKDYSARERVDVIVTNPPFGGMEEDGIETNFPATYQTRETADLFLVLIMHILKDGGRAAIVLPDGTLFGEGVKSRIKERLLTECNLHTIVRLPNGVFAPYTGIKTNLLFFEKGKPTKEIWYYEHTYPESNKSYSKTKPIRIEEFDSLKAWWMNRTETDHAWRVPVQQVIANGFNLDIKNPNVVPDELGDPVKLLREYERIHTEAATTREALKRELVASLGTPSGKKSIITDLLFEHFTTLATAPDGITRLREMILQIAMRGTLGTQDVGDEPAKISLQRLKENKKESDEKIRKKKKNTGDPIDLDGVNSSIIPHGWTVCCLSDSLELINGRAYAMNELLSKGTPIIRIQNLNGGKDWYYSDMTLEPDKYCDNGDLLFAWSGTFGPYIWKGSKCIYHYHIWKIKLSDLISDRFTFYLFKHLSDKIRSSSHGLMILHMTKQNMENVLIRLPPLAEQHRIVAKVDALMALCDALESQLKEQAETQAKFANAIVKCTESE